MQVSHKPVQQSTLYTHIGILSGSPLKSGRTCTWSMCHGSVVDGPALAALFKPVRVVVDASEREDADAAAVIAGANATWVGIAPRRCISRALYRRAVVSATNVYISILRCLCAPWDWCSLSN
jgi:hypothetical protein